MRQPLFRPLPVRADRLLGLGMALLVPPLSLLLLHGLIAPASEAAGAADHRPMASRAAKQLFQKRCLRCHDADGSGREGRDTMPSIPDFTSHRWQKGRTNAQLVVSILDGKGTQMPGFAGKISREQAHDLAVLIRAFAPPRGKAADKSKKAAGHSKDDFEDSFRQLEEEYDRLHKELRELPRKRKE